MNLVQQAKDVMARLRTTEAESVNGADLHILQVQLYLLEKEIDKVKAARPPKPRKRPAFPPFESE
jgi:hypothetical protein